MRRNIFLLALLACSVTLAAELWSSAFDFDGTPIDPTEATVLYPTGGYQGNPATPISYNTALAQGTPVSLDISYTDQDDVTKTGVIYSQNSSTPSQGSVYWNYISTNPADVPRDDTYTITVMRFSP